MVHIITSPRGHSSTNAFSFPEHEPTEKTLPKDEVVNSVETTTRMVNDVETITTVTRTGLQKSVDSKVDLEVKPK